MPVPNLRNHHPTDALVPSQPVGLLDVDGNNVTLCEGLPEAFRVLHQLESLSGEEDEAWLELAIGVAGARDGAGGIGPGGGEGSQRQQLVKGPHQGLQPCGCEQRACHGKACHSSGQAASDSQGRRCESWDAEGEGKGRRRRP